MMAEPLNISGITPGRIPLDPKALRAPSPSPAPKEKTFKDVLTEAVGEVQRLQEEADTTIKKLVAGEIKDVSEAMIAVEKADVSFQTMMAVRNKMVEAYQEIMRIQV